jgi:hypothetical protein
MSKKSEPKQDASSMPAMTTDFTMPSADADTLYSLHKHDKYWFYHGLNGEVSAALDVYEASDLMDNLKDIKHRHRR